jgi:hypothetical protein
MRKVIRQWVRQKVLLTIFWSAGHRMSDRSFQQPVTYFALHRFGDTVRFLLSGIALSCISCRVTIAYSVVVRIPEGSKHLENQSSEGRKTLALQGIYKACLNEIV